MPMVMAARWESARAARTFYDGFVKPRREAIRRVLDRAVARGEIKPVADAEWIIDLMSAPFLIRAIQPEMAPIDERLVQQAAENVLRELHADPAGKAEHES